MIKARFFAIIALSILVVAQTQYGFGRNLFPRAGEGIEGSSDHWTYSQMKDPNSGKSISKATLAAQNRIDTIKGEQLVMLSLGKSGNGGFVELNLHDGNWDFLHGGRIAVSFDGAEPIQFDIKPADMRGYLIVFKQPLKLISLLSGTKTMTITADTEGHPAQTIVFKTENFILADDTP